MRTVIGETLPVALGVAISPVPIIAVILMLLSPRATSSSVAFLVGWVIGVSLVLLAVTLLMDPVEQGTDSDPSTVAAVLSVVLGALAVLLGVRQWGARPKPGEQASLPSWMSAVDSVTPVKALGLGALLSGVNPKNLTLCLAGGATIGAASLSAGDTTLVILVFVVIASSTVGLPVIGYLVAREAMAKPLDELRAWLTEHNAAVMSVLLLVIGVAIFGKGLAAL